jgi:hypothetical protein
MADEWLSGFLDKSRIRLFFWAYAVKISCITQNAKISKHASSISCGWRFGNCVSERGLAVFLDIYFNLLVVEGALSKKRTAHVF